MKQLKLSLIITAGILAIILACIFGVNSFKNNAISQEERVNSAMSDVKVYEKRRADLIPNLVDTVKAYVQLKNQMLFHGSFLCVILVAKTALSEIILPC